MLSKIEQLKMIIEAWGYESKRDVEQEKIEVLNQALKQAIIKETQETQCGYMRACVLVARRRFDACVENTVSPIF